jgi:hypothetical protein
VYIGNDRKDFIIVREVASEEDALGPRFQIALQRVNSQLQWEVLRNLSASYPQHKVSDVTFVQSTDGFFTLITKRDVVLVD